MISLNGEIAEHKKASPDPDMPDPFNIIISQSKFAPQPKVGDVAPKFSLPNQNGETVSLQTLISQGPVILSFFKGNWCQVCDLELKALQRSLPEFAKYGAIVLGISPHTVSISYELKEKKQLSYTILSDAGNRIAEQFGLRFPMNNMLFDIFKSFGVDNMTMIHGDNGNDTNTLAIPGTFVIDSNGKVVFAFADSDHTNRAEPAEIVACLASIS